MSSTFIRGRGACQEGILCAMLERITTRTGCPCVMVAGILSQLSGCHALRQQSCRYVVQRVLMCRMQLQLGCTALYLGL